jgi:addiction module RelE/StbE family toxin
MKVKWTTPALRDLREAIEFIAKENPVAARTVAVRIRKASRLVADHPQRGRPGRCENTRELIIPGLPYIIAYREQREAVEILRVLHTARKWPDQF